VVLKRGKIVERGTHEEWMEEAILTPKAYPTSIQTLE
jgi:ABC-type bacteriocin/lantibiotic exporter with double-glycine peptidase domain